MSFVTDLLDNWYDDVPKAEDLGYSDSTVFILRYPDDETIVFLGEEGGWMKITNGAVSDTENWR